MFHTAFPRRDNDDHGRTPFPPGSASTNPCTPCASAVFPVAIVVHNIGDTIGIRLARFPRTPRPINPASTGITPASSNGSICRQSAASHPIIKIRRFPGARFPSGSPLSSSSSLIIALSTILPPFNAVLSTKIRKIAQTLQYSLPPWFDSCHHLVLLCVAGVTCHHVPPASANPNLLLFAAVKKLRSLSPSTSSRLASYSSSAAVGALSIASSNAAIVYFNGGNTLLTDAVPNNSSYAFYSVDLNSDTVSDLRFVVRSTSIGTVNPSRALIIAADIAGSAVGVVGQTVAGFDYAGRLSAGTVIDGSAAFLVLTTASVGVPGNLASMAYGPGFPASEWAFAGSNSGYLGLRFNIGTAEHFAWMRLTVEPQSSANPRAITVHEWAFENVPGVGIEAGAVPEPSALGLLALGSVGLAARRRKVA